MYIAYADNSLTDCGNFIIEALAFLNAFGPIVVTPSSNITSLPFEKYIYSIFLSLLYIASLLTIYLGLSVAISISSTFDVKKSTSI